MSDELKEWDYATRTIVAYGRMRKDHEGKLQWVGERDLPDAEVTIAPYAPPMCPSTRRIGSDLLALCGGLEGHSHGHFARYEGVDLNWMDQ